MRSNNTAEKALDATPFSGAAKSTQQLADTADTVGRIGKVAGPIGTLAGPLVGAYEASTKSTPDATIGDRFANVIGGGLKKFDDAAISGVSGVGVTALQFAASPFTGPAAPAVAIAAPASGAAAAVAASEMYDDTGLDNVIDSAIDNYVEPVIASTVNGIVSGAQAISNAVSSTSRTVKSWF